MRKFPGVIVVATAMAVVLAAWTSGGRAQSAGSAAPAASGALTMAVTTDPGNLDPQLTLLGAARTVDSFAYDSLLTVVGPGKIATGLAKSWKVISAKRVQLTLRRGVTCADGTKMTASVVKRNLDFVANPANQSPYFGVAIPPTTTATANDRTATVTVTTAIPSPFLLQGLGLIQIVCARGLANRSLLDRGTVGSGPYTLVEAVSGDHYTFQVRKGYTWGPDGATTAAPRLPARVVLKVIPNETTAANLLLTGGVNVATITGADRSRLNSKSLFRRVAIGFPLEFFFNQKAGRSLSDARVRRAVVQAMNLNQIGGVATSGRGLPMTQLTRQDLTPCPATRSPAACQVQPAGREVGPLGELSEPQGHLPDGRHPGPHPRDGARAAAARRSRREGGAPGDDHRCVAGSALRHQRLGRRSAWDRCRQPVAAEVVLLGACASERRQLLGDLERRVPDGRGTRDAAGRSSGMQVLDPGREGALRREQHRPLACGHDRHLREERDVLRERGRGRADELEAHEVR